MKNKALTILALIAITASITACGNTVRGAGKDIQKAGQAIEKAAN